MKRASLGLAMQISVIVIAILIPLQAAEAAEIKRSPYEQSFISITGEIVPGARQFLDPSPQPWRKPMCSWKALAATPSWR